MTENFCLPFMPAIDRRQKEPYSFGIGNCEGAEGELSGSDFQPLDSWLTYFASRAIIYSPSIN